MSIFITGLMRISIVTAMLGVAGGCSSLSSVQPWEKGTLARPEMTFKANGLDTKYSEHIYNSREAAAGGAAVGGGGCGCN
jgi:hypothetical protein